VALREGAIFRYSLTMDAMSNNPLNPPTSAVAGDMQNSDASSRTRVRRLPERGSYERDALDAVLDEGLVCHIGFNDAAGPVVIPTLYCRDGDRILIHGSAASRMVRVLREGAPVCVTVTLIDGLVLARSAFHHSVNYRSAVVFGTAKPIRAADETMQALGKLVEHVVPGRWQDVREPSAQELKATAVLAIAIEEFSVKTRTGPPKDDEPDYALPVWAGVLPLMTTHGPAEADPRLPSGTVVPDYVQKYTRKRAKR
jgi:nitroimidazol reductase NimA-like FMN-containing flavoprotein (pyridoxamine 5'-phosphate oxidase superfamily)